MPVSCPAHGWPSANRSPLSSLHSPRALKKLSVGGKVGKRPRAPVLGHHLEAHGPDMSLGTPFLLPAGGWGHRPEPPEVKPPVSLRPKNGVIACFCWVPHLVGYHSQQLLRAAWRENPGPQGPGQEGWRAPRSAPESAGIRVPPQGSPGATEELGKSGCPGQGRLSPRMPLPLLRPLSKIQEP